MYHDELWKTYKRFIFAAIYNSQIPDLNYYTEKTQEVFQKNYFNWCIYVLLIVVIKNELKITNLNNIH